MQLKILFLLGGFGLWLIYGCEDTGLEPIDMPDPTDTIPIVDTVGKALIDEIKGDYLGTCYIHNMTSMEYFDTLYNVTVTIDSLERVLSNGTYRYVLTDGWYVFGIPETEFVQDTVDMHAIGPSQRYSKSYQFIRSNRSLYLKAGVYPGFGFMISECYCIKQ